MTTFKQPADAFTLRPPAPADDAHWYVVHTKPNQESRAADNLRRQGFTVFLPVLQIERLQRGKLRLVEEPLFKRYLFVQFDAAHSAWHVIRSTLGVSALLRTGGQLTYVPPSVIEALMQQPNITKAMFAPGETLRVTDGPFRDLQVVFELQDGAQRAIVLVELLNKMQRIALNVDVLRKEG